MKKKSPLKYFNPSNTTSNVKAIGDGLSNASNRFTPISENGCEMLESISRPTFVLEKHLTVVRKGPTAPPKLEMFPFEQGRAVIQTPTNTTETIIKSEFRGSRMHNGGNWSGSGFSNSEAGRAFDGQDISICLLYTSDAADE